MNTCLVKREAGRQGTVWATEKILSNYYSNKLALISTGGVGSEYLTRLLNIEHTKEINPNTNRPIKGAFVHFPRPPLGFAPKAVIYVYGDIFNSILSQVGRHPENAAKLCNSVTYQKFHDLQQLFDSPSTDPFNIQKQIMSFHSDKINCPLIILKYNFDTSLIPILIKLTGKKEFNDYNFRRRKSKFKQLSDSNRAKLRDLYGSLNTIVRNSPDLIIRFPSNNTKLSQNDVLKYVVKNKLPGNRVKHYKCINGYEIYNERDCKCSSSNKFGRLRIKKRNEKRFGIVDFADRGITLKGPGAGVEDFRYISYKKSTLVIMNGKDAAGFRNMYIYNVNRNRLCKLYINNYDISSIKIQKNWTPYVWNDKIYFIYSFSELCVLELINLNTGECSCIKGNPFNYDNDYKYFGSTPLIQWNYPNYIGFLHTRLPHYSVPVVFDVEKLEVKHIGEQIIFTRPECIVPWREKIVQFPYDLCIQKDNIVLSVEFEDKCPTLIYLDYIAFCKAFSV